MDQYTFVWRGKDPQGNVCAKRVVAPNAQQARGQLAEAGWTGLELIKDEIGAVASRLVDKDECVEPVCQTAEDEVDFVEGKNSGLFVEWMKSLWDSKKAIVVLGALFGLGYYWQSTRMMVIAGILLVVIIFFFPAVRTYFSSGSRNYSRLNRAKTWARWNEVIECVEQLRRNRQLLSFGVGEVELVRCHAQAMAGLGRLDEGVAEFRRFENDPKLEHWMYLSHLSSIYDVAKAYEQSLECRQQAVKEKPDNSAMWIDLSYGLARGLNRPAEAREALAKAESMEITGLGKVYVIFLKGIICWREKKLAEAKKQFGEALAGLQPLSHHDLVKGLMLLTKSYLCAVQSQLGEKMEATKLFREMEKFMVANREDELLQACRGAA